MAQMTRMQNDQPDRVGKLQGGGLVEAEIGEQFLQARLVVAPDPAVEKPSKVVVPMIVQISVTVPARIVRPGAPLRGRRR